MRNRTLWVAMQDDIAAERLLHITCRHVKLALEHGDKNTQLSRKQAIVDEIQKLRAERNQIINKGI
ncbi:hypothetical protein [Paenibacillus sp. Soil750]|uniref:hypothetical protein n=1 Tax=Paenibacillus sp. Soil750 TaxID=1736398 RepID=UPI0006F3BBCF|nr:hypothetical protein [Paenibacillus sp. Soil750]KRE70860.1 hypothetical protein ASL11_11240 [Paenibacillus sp. Soil750]